MSIDGGSPSGSLTAHLHRQIAEALQGGGSDLRLDAGDVNNLDATSVISHGSGPAGAHSDITHRRSPTPSGRQSPVGPESGADGQTVHMAARTDGSTATVTRHFVFLCNTPEDILWLHVDGGQIEDADGNIVLPTEDGAMTVPLKGLYRLQRFEDGLPEAGSGRLLSKVQFVARYGEFEEPYFEYGVKFLGWNSAPTVRLPIPSQQEPTPPSCRARPTKERGPGSAGVGGRRGAAQVLPDLPCPCSRGRCLGTYPAVPGNDRPPKA